MDRRLVLPLALAGCFYVTEGERAARWDADGDGVERPADCDDADPDVADEVAFHPDADGDGFGDGATVERGCVAPEGFVADASDCDDADGDAWPGAPERCDGADDDCDGAVDEDLPDLTWYLDEDGDGYGVDDVPVEGCGPPEGYVAPSGDCDDDDPDVNPGAEEVCNGVDDDCAGGADEDDPAFVPPSWYPDLDLDGAGAGVPTIGCDGPPGAVPDGDDCDDGDPDVNPGADERCNGVDDDCDDEVDVGAVDASLYFADTDGDGYGDAAAQVVACPPPPAGAVANASDCDDTSAANRPGAVECIDGADNDCDGQVDESGC